MLPAEKAFSSFSHINQVTVEVLIMYFPFLSCPGTEHGVPAGLRLLSAHTRFVQLLFASLTAASAPSPAAVQPSKGFLVCVKSCGPRQHSSPFSMPSPPLPTADLLGRCEILIASHGSLAHCLSHLTEISFSAANIITGGLGFKNSLSPVC